LSGGFNLRALTAPDIARCFEMASRIFAAESTLHRALNVELAAYRAYLHPSFVEMAEEGLSFIAVDPNDDSLLGCLIATDYRPGENAPIDPGSSMAPLKALSAELFRGYEPDAPTLLVDMGAVLPEASGRGIYGAMRREIETLAAARGYRLILGALSSETTQHVVLNQMGHRAVAKVPFESFAFDGRYPFAGISRPKALILSEGSIP